MIARYDAHVCFSFCKSFDCLGNVFTKGIRKASSSDVGQIGLEPLTVIFLLEVDVSFEVLNLFIGEGDSLKASLTMFFVLNDMIFNLLHRLARVDVLLVALTIKGELTLCDYDLRSAFHDNFNGVWVRGSVDICNGHNLALRIERDPGFELITERVLTLHHFLVNSDVLSV